MKSVTLKLGVLFSALGIMLAGISAAFAREDFKKMGKKHSESGLQLKDSKKLTVDCDAGVVNIHHTTETKSYIDYNVAEYYTVNIGDDNKIEMKRKLKYFFILYFDTTTSTIDVYLNDNDYEAVLDVSAGVVNIDEDFEFKSLKIDMSAGKINTKNLTVDQGTLDIEISAGKLTTEKITADKIAVDISAGSANIKAVSSDILVDISAGSLNLDIYGDKADYTIKTKVSAGKVYIDGEKKNNAEIGSGSKTVKADLSAGSAYINFV